MIAFLCLVIGLLVGVFIGLAYGVRTSMPALASILHDNGYTFDKNGRIVPMDGDE